MKIRKIKFGWFGFHRSRVYYYRHNAEPVHVATTLRIGVLKVRIHYS